MASATHSTHAHPREGVSSAARVADLGARPRSTGPLGEAIDRLCGLAAELLDADAVMAALAGGW